MKTYDVKETLYRTEDGSITLDPNDGKNAALFVKGSVISQDIAKKAGLVTHDEQVAKELAEKEEDVLNGLKPLASSESKAKTTSKPGPAASQEVK
jgi:hypothetical protein